jgi:hypothetical protein
MYILTLVLKELWLYVVHGDKSEGSSRNLESVAKKMGGLILNHM